MAPEPGRKGSRTERRPATEYSAQSDSGAKPGFALSAWSLIIGGGFILLVLGALLLF